MDELNRKLDRQQSRRYRKRVLAVRAMAGETAWLEGLPLWHHTRVVWETDRGIVTPTRSVIALTQRRLKQIGGSPRASRHALGDPDSRLSHRYNRLAAAKSLLALDEPQLVDLCAPIALQHRDPRVLRRLAAVLPAEAVCLNNLPASPSGALYSCGDRAVPFLLSILADPAQPMPGRALAAMLLGALNASGKWEPASAQPPTFDDPWCERAYAFGLRHGLVLDPSLYVALLQSESTGKLADQLLECRNRAANYLPDTEKLRKLLYRGVTAESLVQLCLLCSEVEPITERISNYRSELPEKPAHHRTERASELRAERAQTISDLIRLLHEYVCGVADPEVVRGALSLTTYLVFARESYHTPLGEEANIILRLGHTVPRDLQASFFHVLNDRRDFIWEGLDSRAPEYLQPWLSSINYRYVAPIAAAVEQVHGDTDLVIQALRLDCLSVLVHYEFSDPEVYRYALNSLDTLGIIHANYNFLGALTRIGCSTVREARQVAGPLLQASVHVHEESRSSILSLFLDELPRKLSEAREKSQRWAQYFPIMEPFLRNEARSLSYALTRTVFAMDGALGDRALPWFRDLVHELDRRIPAEPNTNTGQISTSLLLTAPLAVALAPDDQQAFNRIALTCLTQSFTHDFLNLEKALGVLAWFPLLRSAFIRIFNSQPHRCLDLAVKIGLASQLGKEAMSPLGYLEGSALEEIVLPDSWEQLIDFAPEVEESARSYLLAQHLRGESDAIPPGVRKAFEQPRSYAAELAFLEKKSAANPTNQSFKTRINSLRSRLENTGKLHQEMRVEIAERLGQAGAEANLACADLKMQECYRVRLQTIAGPLPPNLPINDDLVNATLLVSDITENRKLLVRLLRSYVQGDPRPHEKHPANQAFLDSLVKNHVNKDAWLSANPKTYACKGVSGGKVRLVLEQNPLSVLQMGNYFDTCLSFGRFNAFSTVANACELNKRVIYAYDGINRVVGRKLIGLNEQNDIVGFYTYSTLGDEEGKELRSIFRQFCADFAKKCNVFLANTGKVAKLYAEGWYDDGIVEWSESSDSSQPPSHHEISPTPADD